MYLNTLKPAEGSKKHSKRLGRGIGSGKGKTCGKGHKGQKARAGGYHKRGIGFEGGQMPLKRRIPKSGFRSQKALFTEEVRISSLLSLSETVITMESLRKARLIDANTLHVKLILSKGIECNKAITLQGLSVTRGVRNLIESAGGKIEA